VGGVLRGWGSKVVGRQNQNFPQIYLSFPRQLFSSYTYLLCVYVCEREGKSGVEFTRNQTHRVHWRGIQFEIKKTYIKVSPVVVKKTRNFQNTDNVTKFILS